MDEDCLLSQMFIMICSSLACTGKCHDQVNLSSGVGCIGLPSLLCVDLFALHGLMSHITSFKFERESMENE